MWFFSTVNWDLCLVVAAQPLPNVLPEGEPPLPVWPMDTLDLAPCSWRFALPTRALPYMELWSFGLCTPPFYRILMEFTLSFLLSPFFVQSLAYSFFSLQWLSVGGGGRVLSILSPHLRPLSTSRNSSLPSTAFSPNSPLHAVYLLTSVVQVVQIVMLILKSVF